MTDKAISDYAKKVNAMKTLTWVQKYDLIQQFMKEDKDNPLIGFHFSVSPRFNADGKLSEAESVETIAHDVCMILAGLDDCEDVTDDVLNSGIY